MEEIIKELPRRSPRSSKDLAMYNYQGHWNVPEFIAGTILAQQNYKAQPSDILLCSCPKTGTTWLKALAFAIFTRKKLEENSTNPLLNTMPHECIPLLEKDLDRIKTNQETSDFPLVATHLPYASLPESAVAADCKIVYIYRNIKDVMVSYYEFGRQAVKLTEEQAPFEETFEDFCEGFSWCGPYWDHILGYWKASLERQGRILFLKYEDMKMDPLDNVKKLAEFLGYPFSVAEEKAGVVEKIIKLCSFENLSSIEVNKTGKHRVETPTTAMDNQLYFRNAKVGDWKNYFTDEMKEKIEKLMEEKLSSTGLVLS